MKSTTGEIISSKKSLKIDEDESGAASIKKIPIQSVGGDSWKIKDNIYKLIPEIHEALSSTRYTGKSMMDDGDTLTLFIILRDIEYRIDGDRHRKRKKDLQKSFLVEMLQLKTEM